MIKCKYIDPSFHRGNCVGPEEEAFVVERVAVAVKAIFKLVALLRSRSTPPARKFRP
jgi:hypothetical protein